MVQFWAFSDVRSGRLVSKANDPDSAGMKNKVVKILFICFPLALTCAQFHPDGLIFGTGTANR